MEQSLDQRPVTVELADVPLDDALAAVGRRVGVSVSRAGDLYFFGEVKREDRGVLVRRCRRLTADDLRAAVQSLQSDLGQVQAYQDGLLVMADRVEVLVRVSELIDRVENTESPCWALQLHLVALTADELRDLGVEATPALEISAAFAQGSTPGLFSAVGPRSSLNAGLDSMLRVARTSERGSIVAEPFVLMADGSHYETIGGSRVPVPKRVVETSGNGQSVATNGFEYVQTGLTVIADLREQSCETALVTLKLEQSDITGYVEQAPITTTESFAGQAVLTSGGVYLVGSMQRQEESESGGVGLSLGKKSRDKARVTQIWVRAVRVGGSALASVIEESVTNQGG